MRLTLRLQTTAPHQPRTSETPRPNHYSTGLINGFRSGLESKVADELRAQGVPVRFEQLKIEYEIPTKKHKYTPDFELPNGIIIETKGRFLSKDRAKHLLVKAQHPEIDLRFVFQNPQARLSKSSATSYAMWSERNGFKFAKGSIPRAWIDEAPK